MNALYNFEIIRAVYNILSAPQETNGIEPNIIRNALRDIEDMDKELYRWVYVDKRLQKFKEGNKSTA